MPMQTWTAWRESRSHLIAIGAMLLFFLTGMSSGAIAQVSSSPVPGSNEQLLKPEELEALVAPIALYPDTLLAQVLIASTYPLEVVQAERWSNENKNLKGDQLKAAVDKQPWDESVKALVATNSVLTMMSTKLDWTQKLGDAVLAQQPDVMDAIQRLRKKAQANKKLESTKEQKVSVKKEQDKEVIIIEPAVADTIYVPYYEPAVVYGAWPYPAYPPYYFGAPGYIPGGLIATGIAFGAGFALGRWTSGGNYWGGGVNWGNNNITVNRPVNINNIGNNWQHNPAHRQGVRYTNTAVQQKFGNNNLRAGSQDRMDFRGRGGEQVLKPGGDRPGAGDRGPGQRPSAGDRGQGQRPSTADRGKAQRPSGGKGPSAGGSRPSRDTAFGNVQSGKAARAQSQRGRASAGGGGRGGAPAARASGGGGGRAGGGGGRGGGGGGGRRSDIALKHNVVLLGEMGDGLGFYRFSYNGSERAYVGVIAQEVQKVRPDAVVRGRDGYLRVFYGKLGLKFETYDRWIASGAAIPHSRPQ